MKGSKLFTVCFSEFENNCIWNTGHGLWILGFCDNIGTDKGLAYLKAEECPYSFPPNIWKDAQTNIALEGSSTNIVNVQFSVGGDPPDVTSSAAKLGYLITRLV